MTASAAVRAAACILLAIAAPLASAQDDPIRQEIDAEVEKLRPFVEEAQRIQDCAKPVMAQRGLDVDSAYAQLDTRTDAAALRAHVLALYARDLAGDVEGLAKAEAAPGVRAPLLAYALRGAGTFDFPVIARSLSLAAVYLDRALGGPCRPNPDILSFTGVSARAD